MLDGWRKRLMAFMLGRFNGRIERLTADRKRSLLSELTGTVLEIGPGTGVNLRYYRSGIRWIGVEPNPFMHPYLRKEAERLGMQIEIRDGMAERLDLADESLEAVVSSHVLCSVRDLPAVLREVRRVLRPGGRFVFLEHVAAPAGSRLRRIQRWLRPVVRAVADGCCPDREIWAAIGAAGFERVDCQPFPLPLPLVGPHIAGAAVKKS
jgi:ubiquinone/menaquinone biosynthesis C-methylase UbiE